MVYGSIPDRNSGWVGIIFPNKREIVDSLMSDFICREVRMVSAICDLTGPRVDKLNSFSTSAQCIITGALRLPSQAKVPSVVAETLTILDTRRSNTPTTVPLTTGKRSFLHSQMVSNRPSKEDKDVPTDKAPATKKTRSK